jgi:hypothetical protein
VRGHLRLNHNHICRIVHLATPLELDMSNLALLALTEHFVVGNGGERHATISMGESSRI